MSFNGAAIFRSRKRAGGTRGHGLDHPASMEPRSFDRGNIGIPWAEWAALGASMEPRSFDRGNHWDCPDVLRVDMSFNGAAIFRSRKHPSSALLVLCHVERFNGAAIFRSRKLSFGVIGSHSTQPLQWSRDLSIAETCGAGQRCRPRSPCFNGAAIFRSRKPQGHPPTIHPSASLQWSRDLSIAETTLLPSAGRWTT